MRIADRTYYEQFTRGLAESRSAEARALAQLADGKRVRVSSDDPAAAHAALGLRSRLAALAGYERSAQAAQTDLATIDAALEETISILTTAQTQAMSSASGAFPTSNDAVAEVIDGLRDQLLALANTKQNGRYLFAGTATLTAPFATDGSYQGDTAEVDAPVDTDQSVASTVDGSRVFLGAGDLFARLEGLSTALRNDDADGIQAAATALAGDIEHVIAERSVVGARLTRLDRLFEHHADESVRLQQGVARLEDADLSQVIVELQQAQTAWTALSSAGASVLGRSLFDYRG